MTDLKTLLLSHKGRVGRWPFFLFFSAAIMIGVVVGFLPGFFPVPDAVLVAFLGATLGYPALCILIKRLHDLGLSGRWALLLIPEAVLGLALPWFSWTLDDDAWIFLNPVVLIAAVALRILTLFLLFRQGQAGSNRFGTRTA